MVKLVIAGNRLRLGLQLRIPFGFAQGRLLARAEVLSREDTDIVPLSADSRSLAALEMTILLVRAFSASSKTRRGAGGQQVPSASLRAGSSARTEALGREDTIEEG